MNPNPLASVIEYRPQIEHRESRSENVGDSLPPHQKFVPYPTSSASVVASSPTFSAVREFNNSPVGNVANANVQFGAKKLAYKSKRVFKVIIIGDANVGKTCLSFRFCNGRFPGQTEATIGVDFRERSLVVDGELIRVQLWDTAGQERYRQSIVAHYYRNVNAVVFVYDVTNPHSFKSLSTWISECQRYAVAPNEDTPRILIGNKCDLVSPSERVKTSDAQIFADENDMALFETSALADSESDHVESIFMTLVHKLRHSKTMHVQPTVERQEKSQRLLLKAEEMAKMPEGEGWCC